MSNKNAAAATLTFETDYTADERAEIGSRYNVGRLVDGANERLGYAAEDDEILSKLGADAAWRAALAAKVAIVEGAKGKREVAGSAARQSGLPAGAAHLSLEEWVHFYEAVVAAPRKIAESAPRPPRGWQHEKQIDKVVEPCVQFLEANKAAVAAHGGTPAFIAEGRALAADFGAKRTTHQTDLARTPASAKELHAVEGTVYLALAWLSEVAHKVLPHERAKLYSVNGLRAHGHDGAQQAPRQQPGVK